MKYIYNFNQENKEYIGAEEAFLDPLESEKQGKEIYLLPANATFIKPPETKEGFAIVWNGEMWEYIEDNRGITVWKSYNESMVIKELGAIPEGWSVEQPKIVPTTEDILQGYEDAVQAHLDKTAQSRGYDNTYTCLSYLSSTDETWHREANAFNSWRDSIWRKCHEILNAFMAGEIAQPTVEELIEQLPVIDWNDPVTD